jgi:hypothetical protein
MKTLTLALAIALPLHAATLADWQHDLDEIVKSVETIHPNAFTKVGRTVFLNNAAALRAELPSLTDEQRLARSMRLVASIGDGHTNLEPASQAFALWYPIRVYDFTDGYFVTAAHNSVADLAGAQLLEIAGKPAREVIEAARDFEGSDNEFGRREGLYPLLNAALMRGLGYANADGQLRVKFKLRNGSIAERTLTPQQTDDGTFEWRFRTEVGAVFGKLDEWVTAYKGLTHAQLRVADNARPPHLTARGPFVARAIGSDTYYIQFNQENDALVPFIKKALAEVDQLKPKRLIVDIRFNFGGDGSVCTTFIHQFIKREDAAPWKELYVLTGRKTFSAGVMMLNEFIEHTHATLIGEPAGAGINSYGDATSIDLPRIGAQLHVSTLWNKLGRSDDTRTYIPVDVPALFSFADWADGRDPAVDPIARGDEMRGIALIAGASGAAAARDAAQDRTKRFAGIRGWEHSPEIALRWICGELQDAKKLQEALDVCALNTAIHPEIWNTWYNLGRAQRRLGMGQEALANFAKVFDIDPGNFNGPVLRALMESAKGAQRPEVFRWGATVAATQSAITCRTMNTRRIDPPFLDNVKEKQMQIDCDGFMFQGKPRWTEFVFRDDSLEMVWIMTTKEDEPAILASMKAAFGDPTHQNAKYIAFERYGTALRLDKAEVLFYSPRLAGEWSEEFTK